MAVWPLFKGFGLWTIILFAFGVQGEFRMQGSEHFLGVSWLGITFGFGAQYGTHREGLENRLFFLATAQDAAKVNYYDILVRHAFGNYLDVLREVG